MREATVKVLQDFAAKKRQHEQAQAFAVDLASERASRRKAEAGALEVATARSLCALPDPHSGDSNDERQAVELMRRFDAWRERYGFALLLAVHLRKPPQGASSRSTSSSAPRPTSAEVVVGLQRVREGYSRLYFFKDRDGDLPIGAAWGPLFDREQGFRRDPDDEKPKQTAGEVIASCLPLSPP
jgi:hypothetical protein